MKTQKNEKRGFKKRALVSSVAMLLVATVAVGSATFAWFTSNKSVTADSMTVKASAAQGLQITGTNGASWAPSYTFKAGERTIQPISLDCSEGTVAENAFYPQEAKQTGAWTGATDDADNFLNWQSVARADYPTPATTGEAVNTAAAQNYFVAYEVGIKNSSTNDTDKIENVKMRINMTGDGATYARAAVIKQSANAVAYASDEIIALYGNETDTTPNAITSVTPTTADQDLKAPSATNSASADVAIDDVTNTAQYYTVLVWYEGQDPECVDTNQAKSTDISITFYYN